MSAANSYQKFYPIHAAVQSGNQKLLAKLVKKQKDGLSKGDSSNRTALHVATAVGNIDMVRHLLQKYRVNPNVYDTNGYTPLFVAVKEDHLDIAELLVNCSVDSKTLSKLKENLLHLLVLSNHVSYGKKKTLFTTLIGQGVDINQQNTSGDTPLHLAIRKGKDSMVKMILMSSAEINVPNKQGNTALHEAVLRGDLEILEMITTQKELNPVAVNQKGQTPIALAEANSNGEIANYLRKKFPQTSGGGGVQQSLHQNVNSPQGGHYPSGGYYGHFPAGGQMQGGYPPQMPGGQMPGQMPYANMTMAPPMMNAPGQYFQSMTPAQQQYYAQQQHMFAMQQQQQMEQQKQAAAEKERQEKEKAQLRKEEELKAQQLQIEQEKEKLRQEKERAATAANQEKERAAAAAAKQEKAPTTIGIDGKPAPRTVIAAYPYKGSRDDMLSFDKNVKFTLLQVRSKEWAVGELNGKKGLFPLPYIRELTDEEKGGTDAKREEEEQRRKKEEEQQRRKKEEEEQRQQKRKERRAKKKTPTSSPALGQGAGQGSSFWSQFVPDDSLLKGADNSDDSDDDRASSNPNMYGTWAGKQRKNVNLDQFKRKKNSGADISHSLTVKPRSRSSRKKSSKSHTTRRSRRRSVGKSELRKMANGDQGDDGMASALDFLRNPEPKKSRSPKRKGSMSSSIAASSSTVGSPIISPERNDGRGLINRDEFEEVDAGEMTILRGKGVAVSDDTIRGNIWQAYTPNETEKPGAPDKSGLVLTKNNQVRGGSVDQLVRLIVQHPAGGDRTQYINTFVLTYASFTNPSELLYYIRHYYNNTSDLTDDEKEGKVIRLRAVNFCLKWIPSAFNDCRKQDLKLYKKFANEVSQVDGEHLSKKMLDTFTRAKTSQGLKLSAAPSFSSIPPNPVIPQRAQFTFLELDPAELARQLTIREHQLYKKISAVECLGQGWTKKDRKDRSPNIIRMIHEFNRTSEFIMTAVLYEPDTKQRAKVIEACITCGETFLQLNNFNGINEVVSALGCSPIHRLTKTWRHVPKPKVKALLSLRQLMDPQSNCKNYREALACSNPPIVPFVGMYFSDLVFLEDGNPDYLKEEPTFHNFHKRTLIASVIQQLRQFQDVPYNLIKVDIIQSWLETQKHYDEETLYQKSLTVQKRKPQK